MTDKELEDYIKTIDPGFNSHLGSGTIEMSNEYYNLLEERTARLINENQNLKNIINQIGFEPDKIVFLQQENAELKKQVEYLRSGEYLNQLKFERDMLQDVANNGEVSKEDKEFIDCTHRNTELLEENDKLKKQLEENKNPLRGIFAQVNDDTLLRDCGAMQSEIDRYETQQKEFIKYLEDEMEIYSNTFMEDMLKELEEILQKYEEIIGVSDENNNK